MQKHKSGGTTMNIGNVIKRYRQELGFTQEEVAKRLGVTTPAVNKWENGNTQPDISLIAPIARLFGITTDFTAQLSNFNWEQVFVVSKKDLGNGKLDIKFKSTEESEVNFSIFRFTSQRQNMKELPFPIEQTIKGNLKKLDFTPVKNQLKKVAQLILETLQSDLK